MTRYSKSERELIMEVLKPSMGAGAYIKDFRKSDAPQFKGKTEKEKDKMAVAAYLDAKDEMDENKLPPHLAKLFDKDGNFKDKKKQAMFDKMQKAARKGIKYTVKDVTPKGYGPSEEIEEAKKPSMQSLFNLIADTKNAQEGIAKIMKALKVDEKKASAIMDKLIAYALKKEELENEGFASDAQRRAAFASGYKAKGKDKKKDEQIQEDGHTDVPSSIRMCKNIAEDAGEIEQALASKGDENLDTWWTNKLAVASNSMNKLRDYITTPVQEEQMEETIKEGVFSKEYEPGQYQNGDEKSFVNAIKKSGGKNIDVQKPTKRDPMLTIEFDGDVKKAQKEVSRVGDGTEAIEEKLKVVPESFFRKITGVDKPVLEGRKSSYDTDDDEEGANKHIIMQLRKAQNLRGMFNVEFENGEKKKVPDRVAIAALTKHGRFRTSIEKAAFEKKIRKSYRDLLNALKEK